jgi:hypothetical protein
MEIQLDTGPFPGLRIREFEGRMRWGRGPRSPSDIGLIEPPNEIELRSSTETHPDRSLLVRLMAIVTVAAFLAIAGLISGAGEPDQTVAVAHP